MQETQIVTIYRYKVDFSSVWFGLVSEQSFSVPQNPVQLTLYLQKQPAFQQTTQNCGKLCDILSTCFLKQMQCDQIVIHHEFRA